MDDRLRYAWRLGRILALILIVGIVNGCRTKEQELVGRWYCHDPGQKFTVLFREDGVFTNSMFGALVENSGKWKLENGQLVITMPVGGKTMTATSVYQVSPDKLVFTAFGTTHNYTRTP